MVFSPSALDRVSMWEAAKTLLRPATSTMATDTATSEPILLAARILAVRVLANGLTSQLFKNPLWVRLGTWVEIRCARTGTRIWTSQSSANSRLQNGSEWNSVSKCLTRLTLPFGRFRSRAWRIQTSGKSRIRPTYLDSYSSESSFTSEYRLRTAMWIDIAWRRAVPS